MPNHPPDYEENLQVLKDYLKQRNLRHTHQREVVLSEFLKRHQHVTIEQLWERVRKIDVSIGYATVYRCLRLFTECGIANKHDFGGGSARFEQESGHHHDHMICTRCGKIIEFENEAIETLQAQVSRQYNFQLTSHKMELYGRCSACRSS